MVWLQVVSAKAKHTQSILNDLFSFVTFMATRYANVNIHVTVPQKSNTINILKKVYFPLTPVSSSCLSAFSKENFSSCSEKQPYISWIKYRIRTLISIVLCMWAHNSFQQLHFNSQFLQKVSFHSGKQQLDKRSKWSQCERITLIHIWVCQNDAACRIEKWDQIVKGDTWRYTWWQGELIWRLIIWDWITQKCMLRQSENSPIPKNRKDCAVYTIL